MLHSGEKTTEWTCVLFGLTQAFNTTYHVDEYDLCQKSVWAVTPIHHVVPPVGWECVIVTGLDIQYNSAEGYGLCDGKSRTRTMSGERENSAVMVHRTECAHETGERSKSAGGLHFTLLLDVRQEAYKERRWRKA